MIGSRPTSAARRLRSSGKCSINGGTRRGAGIRKKRRSTTAATEGRKRQRIEHIEHREQQQEIDQQIQQFSNHQGKSLSSEISIILLRMMLVLQHRKTMTQT